MSVNGLRLCTCTECSAYRSFDPVTGCMLVGQYVGEAQFKEHRRRKNAVQIGSSYFGLTPGHSSLQSPIIHNQTPLIHLPPAPSHAVQSNLGWEEEDHRQPESNNAILHRLREILVKLDSPQLLEKKKVIFRNPPSRMSPPMSNPQPAPLELEPTASANAEILHHEKLLRSAHDVIEIIQSSPMSQEVRNQVDAARKKIQNKEDVIRRFKMSQWECLRSMAVSMSPNIRRVDTTKYLSRPFAHFSPITLICHLVVAFMHLICAVSLHNCRFLLIALGQLNSLSIPVDQDLAYTRFRNDIPRNPQAILSALDLEPVTKAFVCCPKCFSLYPYDPDSNTRPPSRCTRKPTPTSSSCNASLLVSKASKKTKTKGKQPNEKPIRLFSYHELQDWIAQLYSRPDIEQFLDRDFNDVGRNDPLGDVWDSPILRSFLGPENDPNRPFLERVGNEGRVAFGLNMDGFNPFMNKESGKKATVGAIYLVCLNLPLSIRYKVENMFLVGIIPGPSGPSKEQINHILTPLVDDLLQLWHHGYFLTSTPKHPHGRLVRGAVIPLICDLPAARQMGGYAGHASNNFCSFCILKATEINNLDYLSWPTRSEAEHRELAQQWKDAKSEGTRDNLFQDSGVRWSELLRLPYWDPTRFLLIDSMHCFFLGMFQRHCRQVWGMNVDIADTDYPSFAHDKDRPSDGDMKSAFTIFRHGTGEEVRKLKVPILRELARGTNVLPFGGKAKKVIADLLSYRIQCGWFNEDGEALDEEIEAPVVSTILQPPSQASQQAIPTTTGKHSRNAPLSAEEISDGLKALESGSKSKIKQMRKKLLLRLCLLKNLEANEKLKVVELTQILEDWRIREGIVDASGNIMKGQRASKKTPGKGKRSGVLGRETLKAIRSDMDNLELPSWLAAAPRQPGEAKQGKLTADQWRTFCTINLTITLNRLWGQEAPESRRRLMLDNFMHLVAAVKLASMRCMTPTRIQDYAFHMHSYLSGLLKLYPNTALSPYQHLALHIPRFLEDFGPVQAWRCFPFERYNFLLQNIPTNMKFGELETTMTRKFCMTQELRRHLDPQTMPPELGSLLTEWKEIDGTNIRGTLLHDSLAADHLDHVQEEIVEQDLTRLIPAWYRLLQNWVREHHSHCDATTLSSRASMRSSFKRLGETFSPETHSANNSHIYYKGPGDSIVAGIIQGIFTHTRNTRENDTTTDTFFVVQQYKAIPEHYEQNDPYRRFPGIAGRLYRDSYYDGETIISNRELLYHFAFCPIAIPEIPFPCIVALPLDR